MWIFRNEIWFLTTDLLSLQLWMSIEVHNWKNFLFFHVIHEVIFENIRLCSIPHKMPTNISVSFTIIRLRDNLDLRHGSRPHGTSTREQCQRLEEICPPGILPSSNRDPESVRMDCVPASPHYHGIPSKHKREWSLFNWILHLPLHHGLGLYNCLPRISDLGYMEEITKDYMP